MRFLFLISIFLLLLAFPASAAERIDPHDPHRFLQVKEWLGEYSLKVQGVGETHGRSEVSAYSANVSINRSEHFKIKFSNKEELNEGAVWSGPVEGSWQTQNTRFMQKSPLEECQTVEAEKEERTLTGGKPVKLGEGGNLEIDAEQGIYIFNVAGEVRQNEFTYKDETIYKGEIIYKDSICHIGQPISTQIINQTGQEPVTVGAILSNDNLLIETYLAMGGWYEIDPDYMSQQQAKALQMLPFQSGFSFSAGSVAASNRGEKLPESGLVISGRKIIPINIPFVIGDDPPATGQIVINWRLRPANMEEDKLFLTPVKKDWWPEKNNTIEPQVTWEGGPPTELKFTLYEISREKGAALGPKDDDDSPDLEFDRDQARAYGYQITKVSDTETTATTQSVELGNGKILIRSLDYGSFGKLKAKALMNGSWVEAEVKDGVTDGFINLPLDDNQNSIADSWEAGEQAGGKPETWDEESLEGTTNKGDGFTLYEEYRGIFIKPDVHQRMTPKRQEIVIENKIGDAAKPGIALFERATGVKVITVEAGMLGENRIVNINAGTGHKINQTGLRLQSVTTTGEKGVAFDLGYTLPEDAPIRFPKDCTAIEVNGLLVNSPQATLWEGRGEDLLNYTIAHEMTHALGVKHHGDMEPGIVDRTILQSHERYFVYDVDGHLITERPFSLPGAIGLPGGKASGDLDCIMAYPNLYNWVMRREDSGIHYYSLSPLPIGNKLCTSATGTGINANNRYFGDATRGNCRNQVHVKDE